MYIGHGSTSSILNSVRCIKGDGETFAPVVRLDSVVTGLEAETATLKPLIVVDGGKAVTSFQVKYGISRTALSQSLDVEEGQHEDSNGNPLNYAVLTGLTPNTTYYAVAVATNANGTSHSDTITFTTARMTMNVACPGTPYVSDIEGNFYNTVQIGNQCWMKENLRTKRYANGTQIPFNSDTTNGNRVAYYRYPTNNSNYEINIYGYFYSHAAVMNGAPVNYNAPVQGICPTGWHLPSKAEFDTLKANFTAPQLRDVAFWTDYPGTNESGLSLRAAGYYTNQSHDLFGNESLFWYSTTRDTMFNVYRGILFWPRVSSNSQYYLASVRCIKGQGRTAFPPIVTTQTPYGYTQNTFNVKATVNKAGSTISSSGFVIGTSADVTRATASSSRSATIGTDDTMTTSSFSIPYNNQLNFTWYVRGYVTTSDGETSYGNAVRVEVQNVACGSVSTSNPPVAYNTVKIGNQCWMKENLKTKTSWLGVTLTYNEQTYDYDTSYYYRGSGYMLPYSTSTGTLHLCHSWSGYYYRVDEAGSSYHTPWQLNNFIPSNIQSICPAGWHMPSKAEYELLVKNVNGGVLASGSAVSNKLRYSSSTYWSNYATATNSSGFSARGAGVIFSGQLVSNVKGQARFATATQTSISNANNYPPFNYFFVDANNAYVASSGNNAYYAISVRCVKDIVGLSVTMSSGETSTQTFTVSATITNSYNYPIVERGFVIEGVFTPVSSTSNSISKTITRTTTGNTYTYAYVKLSDGSVHISKTRALNSYGQVN